MKMKTYKIKVSKLEDGIMFWHNALVRDIEYNPKWIRRKSKTRQYNVVLCTNDYFGCAGTDTVWIPNRKLEPSNKVNDDYGAIREILRRLGGEETFPKGIPTIRCTFREEEVE